MKYAKRSNPKTAGSTGSSKPVDSLFSSKSPALFEYLTEDKWEDGKPRPTATLLVFAEQGVFKACVNDRANGVIAWFSDERFQGLLEAVERGLADGTAEWRASKGATGRR